MVQSPIQLSDGSEIRLTIARYYTPSGRCIQKKYELGKDSEYEQDIYQRFMHGEFDSADSIKLNNSEKYETVMGRPVYGGGGIMPDIFIPRDTSGVTSYFSNVVNSGTLNLYALDTRIAITTSCLLSKPIRICINICNSNRCFRFHQLCRNERDQETSAPDQHIRQTDRETTPGLHRP